MYKMTACLISLVVVLTACTPLSVPRQELIESKGNEMQSNDHLDIKNERLKKSLADNQENERSRSEKWSEDLDFYSCNLKSLHDDLYKNISETSFDAEVDLLKNRAHRLSDAQIAIELKQITARIGDSHTQLEIIPFLCDDFIPLKFAHIDNEIYCVNTSDIYSDLLFKKITRINGVESMTLFNGFMPLVESENEIGKAYSALAYLRLPDLYVAMGHSTSSDSLVVEYEESGQRVTRRVESLDFDALKTTDYMIDSPINNKLSFLDIFNDTYYWYDYDKMNKILFIHYNRCMDMPDYSFQAFSQDVWTFVNTHTVDKLVLDLRYNTGGFPFLLDDFRVGLLKHKAYNSPEKLYVLTGNATFSAGVLSAATMKLLTNALIIGEPTSGSPNTFGRGQDIELPNSGISLRISSNYQEYYPNYDYKTLMPDVLISRTLNDYKKGLDPVLEYILSQEYKN